MEELEDCLKSSVNVEDDIDGNELKEALDRFLGKIKKVDPISGQIQLENSNKKVNGKKIDIDKVLAISGDLVDYLDDCE